MTLETLQEIAREARTVLEVSDALDALYDAWDGESSLASEEIDLVHKLNSALEGLRAALAILDSGAPALPAPV